MLLWLWAPFCTSSEILKFKNQKVIFGIFYPSLKKFRNGPLKIRKSEHERYLGQRGPIIGSMGYGGLYTKGSWYGLLSRKWVYSVYSVADGWDDISRTLFVNFLVSDSSDHVIYILEFRINRNVVSTQKYWKSWSLTYSH